MLCPKIGAVIKIPKQPIEQIIPFKETGLFNATFAERPNPIEPNAPPEAIASKKEMEKKI